MDEPDSLTWPQNCMSAMSRGERSVKTRRNLANEGKLYLLMAPIFISCSLQPSFNDIISQCYSYIKKRGVKLRAATLAAAAQTSQTSLLVLEAAFDSPSARQWRDQARQPATQSARHPFVSQAILTDRQNETDFSRANFHGLGPPPYQPSLM